MNTIKEQFKGKTFKKGLKSTLISIIVIAAVLAINIFITAQNITVDLTRGGMYSLLDTSEEYFAGVTDDIKIIYFAQDGQQYAMFTKILDKIEACSSHITWEQRDLVKDPEFAKQYTDEEVGEHSFLVIDETTGMIKYLDYYDVITMTIDYQTFQYSVTAVDLEGRVLGAVEYVSNPNLPVVYRLTGHGEEAFSATMTNGFEKSNLTYKDLSLITDNTIPEDCDAIMIFAPQKDLLDEEYDTILNYMLNGGKLVMYADFTTCELPNMMALINHYGLDLTEGLVFEGDSGHYVTRTPYQLVPEVKNNAFTEGIGSDRYVICPYVAGIVKLDEMSDTLFQQAILETTDEAFSKTAATIETYLKEDCDIDGPFYVGMDVTETIDDVKSEFVLYSCSLMLNEGLLSEGTYGNGDLFYNTLKLLTNSTSVSAVRSVSIVQPTIAITASEAEFFGLLDIIIIPVIIIVFGIIVVIRRRRL